MRFWRHDKMDGWVQRNKFFALYPRRTKQGFVWLEWMYRERTYHHGKHIGVLPFWGPWRYSTSLMRWTRKDYVE